MEMSEGGVGGGVVGVVGGAADASAEDTFNSLQCHINKFFGSVAPYVNITNGSEITVPALFNEEATLGCTASGRCHEQATYIGNHFGKQLLYCDLHAQRMREQFANTDKLTWFCKKLVRKHEKEPAYWINVRRATKEYCMPWIWVAEAATTDTTPPNESATGEQVYIFHKERPAWRVDSLSMPIEADEALRLLCQMRNQIRAGNPLFIIGFANDHPFDRPDFTLGYSICKHVGAADENYESYCFKYDADDFPQRAFTYMLPGPIVFNPFNGKIDGRGAAESQ